MVNDEFRPAITQFAGAIEENDGFAWMQKWRRAVCIDIHNGGLTT
ncbi:hypothetical protein CFII64_18828 [Pseudomonas sp. CFII64]|nr:hypothetical protein CFII64_18828 [Pseudomonas sp. CFII64]